MKNESKKKNQKKRRIVSRNIFFGDFFFFKNKEISDFNVVGVNGRVDELVGKKINSY